MPADIQVGGRRGKYKTMAYAVPPGDMYALPSRPLGMFAFACYPGRCQLP